MATTDVPSREELVRRATDLVPLLRANAEWTEQNRRLHEETIEALADAGMFKLRIPKRYGGYECDADTLIDVGTELGRGDGSTAWVTQVYWIPGWMVGMFPDEVQDEVYSTPNVRVCGTLSPSGMATPTDGGYIVNGKWTFISGALHSHWQNIIAVVVPENGPPEPIMGLVPITDLEIIDDWYVSGLRGTGSVSTVATNLFVPKERVLPLGAVLTEQYASVINADSPVWRAPLIGSANAAAFGTMLGLGKGALDHFHDRLNRKLSYTSYESQRESPVTHLRLAEATVKLHQAEYHARYNAEIVDRKGITGEAWKLEERVRSRVDIGACVQLVKDAVNILSTASGGSSIYSNNPIQRINRDIQAIGQHALMATDTTFELYGRILCGLEPNTGYL